MFMDIEVFCFVFFFFSKIVTKIIWLKKEFPEEMCIVNGNALKYSNRLNDS